MVGIDNRARDEWSNEPIAIIGLSSKFSGQATNAEGYWRMLIEGKDGWTPFPASRFNSDGIYHPNSQLLNSTHVKGAHFLEEDIALFDAAFFGYSSETAASTDPQYRLQLESAYEALENAGLSITSIAGSNTSVMMGCFVHDFRDSLLRDGDSLPRLMATGTGVPMMSNRISHFFDLRGPSMTIETACSSGMVATHQGVQSLRSGEADMSIVGGANLTLNPDMFKALASAGFLSADGRSYAFDSRASGYGRGEGVGTLILKRLVDAVAAGDPIRAVIRESLLNQDGKTETITTPSLEAQEALLRGCYRKAGLDPRETQYFEAHGTGTQAGDTVEALAIANVFGSKHEPLLIGSAKTNLGHTEAASGLASQIKVVLALEKGLIPPSINFEKPNPKIPLEDWNLKLVRKTETWPTSTRRRASINNFGYGGANAHIIIEDGASWVAEIKNKTNRRNGLTNGLTNGHIEGHTNGHTIGQANGDDHDSTNGHSHDVVKSHLHQSPNDTPDQNIVNGDHNEDSHHLHTRYDAPKVFIFSGKDELACQKTIANHINFLKERRPTNAGSEDLLNSLAYTLGQRRTRFPWSAAYAVPVSEGLDVVIQTLESLKFRPNRSSRPPRIGFVFSGQGAQWHAMGRELVDAYPVYKNSLLEAETYLEEFGAKWSILGELSRDAEVSRINEVSLSTTICVALQISLVRLLRACGIEPVAVTSHSSGEIAAAYTVGALSYRTALAFSYHRALLAADKSLRGPVKGGMLAVGLGRQDTEAYISRLKSGGEVVVACVNSPLSTTISGDLSTIIELEEMAKAEGVFARRLKVDVAWHSHHMAPLANVYSEALGPNHKTDEDREDALNRIAFSSPVTGDRIASAGQIASPDHWIKSLLQPVQFVDAFTDMILADRGDSAANVDIIVEVGPHTALGGPIQQILALPEFKDLKLPYYGTLVRKTNACESMQALAANLSQEGYPVDLGAVNFPHGIKQSTKVLTDLPSYPWNHQIRHWVEPRFNKALRQRSQPAHDLLGSLVEGCNPITPSWRHILRISESPWTRDHSIQSNIVYPAAGYISLAIEAVKQLTTMEQAADSQEISGYRLKDVDFLQALMIPDDSEGIEIQTALRPVADKDISARDYRSFEIWTVTTDNKWTHHAKGLVTVEFERSSLDNGPSMSRSQGIKGFTRRILPTDLFSNLRALGIAHGTTFQNMKHIIQSGSENRSVVTFAVADTSVPNDLVRDHIIHPVTLDSIITAPYSAVPGAGSREIAAKVPRSVEDLWVSSKIDHEPAHLFDTESSLIRDDSQGMAADVTVFDHDGGHAVLEMKSFSYQSLGRSPTLAHAPWEKQLSSKIDWAPDISFLNQATSSLLKKQLTYHVDVIENDLTRSLGRVCTYFIQQAMDSVDRRTLSSSESHLAKYYIWMERVIEQAASGTLCPESAEWLSDPESIRQHYINEVANTGAYGRYVCRLGDHLPAILSGQTPSSDILSRGTSETPASKRAIGQLSGLLKHLAHKNPRGRILEIGTGAATTTRAALDVLGTPESGGPNASLYHYTHTSEKWLDTAREDFLSWSDLLSFDKLDIEREPCSQGFASGSYDVVIASLTQSNSITHSLDGIKDLLKPGGILLQLENVRSQIDFQFVQGLAPSWSFGEEPQRKNDHLLSAAQWKEYLQTAGFSTDLELQDHQDAERTISITLLSTLTADAPPRQRIVPEDIVIITSNKAGPPPPTWLQNLQASVGTRAEAVQNEYPFVVDLESASATAARFADKICIFVGEIEEPILYDLDSASLAGIRAMCTSCKGLIWVTRGGAVNCERPELSLAPGFVRSLRSEYVGQKLLTLDLDATGQLWSQNGASAVVQVLQNVFSKTEDAVLPGRSATEFEYAERNGVILVPRLYHDIARDQKLSPGVVDQNTPGNHAQEPLYQPDRPLCLSPGSLAFDDDIQAKGYSEVLPPTLIEVEPRAFGANFRASDEHITGLECAGIATRIGSKAAAEGFAVGDRVVCLLSKSSFPSRAFVEWTATAKIPAELSFQDAASLPVAFLTAYFSFVEMGRLRDSQSVLIHNAETAVGQAAIMIAQQTHAEVFATVDGPEKRVLIEHKYNIKASHIFSCRDSSFGTATLAATNGRGVDIVLNSLAGSLLLESFAVVAPMGHFVDIGRHDLENNSTLEMKLFARSISFSAVDLPSLMEYKGPEVHRCLKEVVRLIGDKAVKPVHPVTAYAIGDVVEASQLLQTGLHTGTIVLSVGSDELVPVIPKSASAKLSSEATYLIVGGNGGLGQSVSHWMVSRGAKNLVLLSRSAADSPKTASFVEELVEAGCNRVLPVNCDVASEDDLARAMDTCAREGLPPIRGVIHAAFVLHDSFLEKMTVEDYRYTTRSKIGGAFNLHNQFNLPDDLDFFILFSSINGILGYASQAAYSAAGAYEDALAHWRVKHCGLPGVSIDLSVVNSVGYVAQASASETLRKSLIKAGRRIIDESHVLASLESAILAPYDPQFIVGGISSGPGAHWDVDGELGRDMRTLALKYRQPSASTQDQDVLSRSDSLAAKMAACETSEEAVGVVGASLANTLADMFLVPADEIDLSESPSAQGIDSLVAVEVRNMLFSQAAAELSIFNIMQSPSLTALASDVVGRSTHVNFVIAAA